LRYFDDVPLYAVTVIAVVFVWYPRKVIVFSDPVNAFPVQMRLNGVRRALTEAGITLKDSFIKNGDWEYQSGYDCMRDLLAADDRPTAVFSMNDLMAAGAISAINDYGLSIPGDISLIGFDNREISSYLHPKLTTVNIDLKGIGIRSAQIAIDMINQKEGIGQITTLPCEIIHRGSVKRLG
jgi:LacI family transcriptional regulator